MSWKQYSMPSTNRKDRSFMNTYWIHSYCFVNSKATAWTWTWTLKLILLPIELPSFNCQCHFPNITKSIELLNRFIMIILDAFPIRMEFLHHLKHSLQISRFERLAKETWTFFRMYGDNLFFILVLLGVGVFINGELNTYLIALAVLS